MDSIKVRAKVIFNRKTNVDDINAIQWTTDGDKEIFCNNRFYGESFIIPEGKENGEWTEDRSKQGAEDYTSVALNRCRLCKKIIKPYAANYFEEIRDSNTWYKLYCFENGYCEKCAKAKADIKPEPYRQPAYLKHIVSKKTIDIGGSLYEETTLDNGEVFYGIDSNWERLKNVDESKF